MIELVTALAGAVTEGLKLANTKEALKYVDQVEGLKLQILAEEEKGYDSDDPKLEHLYAELRVLMEACANAIRSAQPKPAS